MRQLLAAVIPANGFYARKWDEAGTSPAIEDLDQFLAQAPFTRKEELVEDQRRQPPYGTNLTFPVERYTRFNQTSGTTGSPLRWLDTPESWSWMVDNWVTVLRESGVRPGERVFFAFSFGPFLGFWTAFEAGSRYGCLCLPGGGMSSAARLRAIWDNEASVLCCTPTYAIHLGEAAGELGFSLDASPVRTLIVAGEAGASVPATRERIERAWPGARVRDHHGMTEVGPVSFECSVRPGVLHIIEESFIPEVIDPHTGRPVPRSHEGELVLTGLGRLGSPLIRYRTGDRVRAAVAERCACGRYDLALEGGILGRTDDMVVVRGVNLYPSGFEAVVRHFAEVAEYRVEIQSDRAVPEIRVELEPSTACGDAVALAREVETALRVAFNLRVPVSVVAPGSLPRYELKARRWVRLPPGGVRD